MKTRNPKVVKFGKPKRERDWSAPLIIGGAVLAGIAGAFVWNAASAPVEDPELGSQQMALFGATASRPYLELCGEGRRVNCVVDGDTLWLDGEKIRVADIDTPEIGSPQCDYEFELGMQATYRFRDLLNEGPFEVQMIGDRDEDRYGRKLRVITRGGRSIGDMLVSEGLARTWTGRREPWC